MKSILSAEKALMAARPSIAAQPRDNSHGRLARSEAEIVAVERWENEGGMVSGRLDQRYTTWLRSRIEGRSSALNGA